MAKYAANTKVPIERSRAELERLLTKHKATSFVSARDDRQRVSIVAFEIGGRRIRTTISDPDLTSRAWQRIPPGKRADQLSREMCRRWRVLVLVTKAKLELIASGDSTVDREFMADILLPSGETVGDRTMPILAAAYSSGPLPPLLEAGR